MSGEPLLTVSGVSKSFRVGRQRLHAVRNVSFVLPAGQTLGLVGESGSGKSTLGRLALALLKSDSGSVEFDGNQLSSLSDRQLRAKRKDMQLIFQNPLGALNERSTVGRNVMDPLTVHGMGDLEEKTKRVHRMLERVGLQRMHADAYPFELSGGQQQRVMIARALILEPKLVVCDEALSALDVSVQAQILDLLLQLQRERHLSYVFIAHNLTAVSYISDWIGVMYLGEIVELAPADELLESPSHPYTKALFDSVLDIPESKEARSELEALPGEIPSPIDLPSGCSFHTRCPLAVEKCRTLRPIDRMVSPSHRVACHFAGEV